MDIGIYFWIILAWNALLTVFLFYLWFSLSRVFSQRGRGFRQIVEESIYKSDRLEKELRLLGDHMKRHQEEAKHNFQKMGIVRFNPFERLGGEQSYSLALLTDEDNGLVVTFLYTREGVRTYVKEVVGAKGKDIDLSREEKEAILRANKLNA